RPLVAKDLLDMWAPGAGKRRFVEGLAMFLQVQAEVVDMPGISNVALTSVIATDRFRYLPPLGLLPIANIKGSKGFDYQQFFNGAIYHDPVFIEGAKLDALVARAMLYPPKDLNNKEMLWLYRERENMQSIADNAIPMPQPFMMFVNGHLLYEGNAQFDLSYWDYANYA